MKKTILTLICCHFLLNATSQFSIQNVVMEVYTGAWSQFSPDGAVIFDQVLTNHSNTFGINLHIGDSMETIEANDLSTFYGPAYPEATFNRDGNLYSRGVWDATASTMSSGASIVTVSFDSVLYNASTREVNVFINALFTGPATGDLRFNCVVVEDSVTGTGSGYDQVNYYNTVAGHPYYGAGNPIVGFPHRNVARKFLGGSWGTVGIIPATVNFGTDVSYQYTYTLPNQYNENRISLVGLVSRYDGGALVDRKILNGAIIELPIPVSTAGIDPGMNDFALNIFPNPSSDMIQFKSPKTGMFTIEIIDGLGRICLSTKTNLQESENFILDICQLEAGFYSIKIGDYTGKFVKK